MAVKNILNYIDTIYDQLSTEIQAGTKKLAFYGSYEVLANSDESNGPVDIPTDVHMELQKKYGKEHTYDEFKQFAKREFNLAKKEMDKQVRQIKINQAQVSFLDTIRHFVRMSEDGVLTNELKKALYTIETTPISGFFSNTPLGKILKDNKKAIVSSDKELTLNPSMPVAAVTPEFIKQLELVHQSLMDVYKLEIDQKNKIVWQHSYADKNVYTSLNPENSLNIDFESQKIESDEIIPIRALVEWKDDMLTVRPSGRAAKDVDVVGMPGHAILGKIAAKSLTKDPNVLQEKFIDLIKEMLKSAFSYTDEEKKLILDWIDGHGDQKMNRFADLLINKNEFTDDVLGPDDPEYSWFMQKPLDMCWYIEDGKIYFEYDVLQYYIRGPVRDIYIDPKQNVLVEGNVSGEKMEELKDLKNADKLAPLARTRGRFYLAIDQDKKSVKPVMQDLLVTSYNNFLKNPERKYGKGKEITSSVAQTFSISKP